MNVICSKKTKGSDTKELLISEKQSLCRYKNEHPDATCHDLARFIQDTCGKKVSPWCIKEVLQRKDHWLTIPKSKFNGKQKRMRYTKIREIENALYVGLCDLAATTVEPITNEVISSKAREFLDEIAQDGVNNFCGSKNWLAGFNRRFHIRKDSMTQNRKKWCYHLDSVYIHKEILLHTIHEAGLENTYLLIPVPLCHLQKPNVSIGSDLPETLMVFLCVNASGTDMLPPLVLGSGEVNEEIDKLHYHQETENSWGFIHWLLLAEKHMKKPALVITGPENFITCLPFPSLKVQVRKLGIQTLSILTEVFDKVAFLFKASFRQMQLKDTKLFDGSYLVKCLYWVRDAWWGLPGGALHGYWHRVPGAIQASHECKLQHNAAKLCAAIEAIALQHLMTALNDPRANPLDVINTEKSLPERNRLTVNEIVNVLMLYDQLFKNVHRNGIVIPENGMHTSDDSSKSCAIVQSQNGQHENPPISPLVNSGHGLLGHETLQKSSVVNGGHGLLPKMGHETLPKSPVVNGGHGLLPKMQHENLPKSPVVNGGHGMLPKMVPAKLRNGYQKDTGNETLLAVNLPNGSSQNGNTFATNLDVGMHEIETQTAVKETVVKTAIAESVAEKPSALTKQLVSKDEAVVAIETVIRYLSYKTEEKTLYRDALKIWTFIDSQP